MQSELKELWRFRELLYTMVQRDLKIRYKNSALGFFWSLLNPALTVAAMSFVFTNFIGFSIPNYTAYLFAAYLPFIFFQNCLMDSAQTVIVAMPLIKKIYFPREILPLASVISNFVNFTMSMAVFFLFLIGVYIFHTGPHGERIWPIQGTVVFLPLLMLISLFLAAGFSLMISAINTFYEDVKYILGVILYLLFFFCPIVYFSELVGNSKLNIGSGGLYFNLYCLNPVAELCIAYRKLILAPTPVPSGTDPKTLEPILIPALPFNWTYLVAAAIMSIIILFAGYAVFNKLKWRFVERP